MGVTKFGGTTMDRSTDTTEKTVEKKSACIKVDEVTDEEDKITLEDLAPDGGWGWMIALAMILIIVSIIIDTMALNI